MPDTVLVECVRVAFGQQFDVPAGYLNTASIGIPPVAAADAVADGGRPVAARGGRGRRTTTGTSPPRGRPGRRLVGVDAERVASGASVSQLVGLVAASVPDGTRVLTVGGRVHQCHVSLRRAGERGVTVTEVPPGDLLSACGRSRSRRRQRGPVRRRRDRRPRRAARRPASPCCSTSPRPPAGCRCGSTGPTRSSAAATSGCSRRAARPGSRCGPDALERTVPHAANWYAADGPVGRHLRPAAAPGRRRARGSTSRRSGSPSSAPRRRCPWLAGLDLAAVRDHCVGLADATLAALGLPPRGSAIISARPHRRAGRTARPTRAWSALFARAGRGCRSTCTTPRTTSTACSLAGYEMTARVTGTSPWFTEVCPVTVPPVSAPYRPGQPQWPDNRRSDRTGRRRSSSSRTTPAPRGNPALAWALRIVGLVAIAVVSGLVWCYIHQRRRATATATGDGGTTPSSRAAARTSSPPELDAAEGGRRLRRARVRRRSRILRRRTRATS